MLSAVEKLTISQLRELEPEFHEGLEIVPIPNEPGFYAREDGTIWTKWTNRRQGRPRKDEPRKLGERFYRVFPWIRKNGRLGVRLFSGERSVTEVVLEAFIGPCPKGMESCHFPDSDVTNNALNNIRWDTHLANIRESRVVKFDDEAVADIKQCYIDGQRVVDIAFDYDVTASCIYHILRGIRRA